MALQAAAGGASLMLARGVRSSPGEEPCRSSRDSSNWLLVTRTSPLPPLTPLAAGTLCDVRWLLWACEFCRHQSVPHCALVVRSSKRAMSCTDFASARERSAPGGSSRRATLQGLQRRIRSMRSHACLIHRRHIVREPSHLCTTAGDLPAPCT